MKRFIQAVCLILTMVLVLAIPVGAQEITPYASNYFASYNTYLWETSSTSFQVWFSVTAKAGMEELGVSSIEVERSSDGANWSVVATYDKDDYSNMISYNTASHAGYVTYSNRQSGYQYRAYVKLYAKRNSSSMGEYGVYAYF